MPHNPALEAWLGVTKAPKPPFRRVTVLVDSRDRNYARFPTPTTYEIDLPTPMHHVVAGRLVGAEIPASYYVFTQARGNTTFAFTSQGNEYTITIPDGNYTSESLIATMQTEVERVLDGTAVSVSFELLPASKQCSIECAETISFEASTGSLAHFLGFSEIATGVLVTGSRPVNSTPEPYLLLDLKEVGAVVESEVKGGGGSASTDTFAKIPITSNSFGYTFEDHTFGVNEMRPPIARMSRLRVSWRFHDGTPVDFQGIEHAMTLEFVAMDSRSA